MDVRVEERPALRAAALRHVGPYNRISEAFGRLGEIAGPAGLFTRPGAMMIAIYHDDPAVTPANELRSDAAIVIADDAPIPHGLAEQPVPGGRYAITVHTGSYDRLPDTWMKLKNEGLAARHVQRRDGPSYEVYLNNPMTAKTEDLKTEICVPVT